MKEQRPANRDGPARFFWQKAPPTPVSKPTPPYLEPRRGCRLRGVNEWKRHGAIRRQAHLHGERLCQREWRLSPDATYDCGSEAAMAITSHAKPKGLWKIIVWKKQNQNYSTLWHF